MKHWGEDGTPEDAFAFNCSGHGRFDLSAYERHMTGKLEDVEYPAEIVLQALADLPKVTA